MEFPCTRHELGGKNREHVEYAYLDYEPKGDAPITGGATYSELKTWIYENYGLKVSSLYIGQIYLALIKANPKWAYAGLYYDLIVTKSISRFARNTTDCLELVRKLAEMDV